MYDIALTNAIETRKREVEDIPDVPKRQRGPSYNGMQM